MGIVVWIVLGLIAGLVARWLMPTAPGGLVVTIILGIVGGLVGGFLGVQLGLGNVDGFNLHSLALAIGGAVLLLFLYGLLKSKGKI